MFRMGPAPRKEGETTKVETYTMGASTDKEQVRINLYYNSADDDRSIIAANATILGTASSTKSKAQASISTQALEVDGDTMIFKDWEAKEVARFTRGVAGTATFNCPTMSGPSPLEGCDGKTSFDVTYEAPVVSDL
jgi:hypothetical protein